MTVSLDAIKRGCIVKTARLMLQDLCRAAYVPGSIPPEATGSLAQHVQSRSLAADPHSLFTISKLAWSLLNGQANLSSTTLSSWHWLLLHGCWSICTAALCRCCPTSCSFKGAALGYAFEQLAMATHPTTHHLAFSRTDFLLLCCLLTRPLVYQSTHNCWHHCD